MTENYLEVNKKLWNNRVDKHVKSDFYDMDSFINGRSSLNEIELNLIGNVAGKDILHVQCHFGQDSLSLARMGAKITGVDFSDKAVSRASQIASELKLDAQFICCNVLEMDKYINKKFDFVYASYGVIGWHPDLYQFMFQISKRLKPKGIFYLIEFHPVTWMFDENFTKIEYSYFNLEPIIEEEIGSYADKESETLSRSYGWNHSFSEIFNALLKNNMRVLSFDEYDYSPYNLFPNTVKSQKGYQIKGLENKLPHIYSLSAILD